MKKTPKKVLPPDSIKIDKTSHIPIYKQLYSTIRQGIISKRFSAYSQLPSSRQLSAELCISRSTVTAAYDQLIAEGLLISKRGSGTHIAEVLNYVTKEETHSRKNQPDKETNINAQLSNLAKVYNDPAIQKRIRTNYQQTSLMPGIPSRLNFPNAIWGKLLGKYAKQALGIDAGYDHPSGIPQLRQAIANYISLARGVNTTAQDILIVSSTQAALDILCRLILNKGDIAGIEEPGYGGAHLAMRNSEASIQAIPIDQEGITLPKNYPAPKLIYTSPSHQYPTGVTMTYTRRMALLDYAKKHKIWILEDDYDSEFRYRGSPLPSLQGLDKNQRVVYLGTFSKSLSPSMRVAYIVAPPTLSAIIKPFLGDIGAGCNITVQHALAEFIEAGHYSRHIRKARNEYAEKQQILNAAIDRYLKNKVDLFQRNAGLQATLFFKEESIQKIINDVSFVEKAKKEGLFFRPLSSHYHTDSTRQGLVIGFAAPDKETIDASVKKLAQLLYSS